MNRFIVLLMMLVLAPMSWSAAIELTEGERRALPEYRELQDARERNAVELELLRTAHAQAVAAREQELQALSSEHEQFQRRLSRLAKDASWWDGVGIFLGITQRVVGFILYPAQSVFAIITNKLTLFLFPLTLVAMALVARTRHSMIPDRWRRRLFIALVASGLMFVAPWVVAAENGAGEEALREEARETASMLAMERAARYLHVLKTRDGPIFDLSGIAPPNSALSLPKAVKRDTYEFEHAMAALSVMAGATPDAVEHLRRGFALLAAEEAPLGDVQHGLALEAIRFLNARGQGEAAVPGMLAVLARTRTVDKARKLVPLVDPNIAPSVYASLYGRFTQLARDPGPLSDRLSAAVGMEEMGEARAAEEALQRIGDSVSKAREALQVAEFRVARDEEDKALSVLERQDLSVLEVRSLVKLLESARERKMVNLVRRLVDITLQAGPTKADHLEAVALGAFSVGYDDAIERTAALVRKHLGMGEQHEAFLRRLVGVGGREQAEAALMAAAVTRRAEELEALLAFARKHGMPQAVQQVVRALLEVVPVDSERFYKLFGAAVRDEYPRAIVAALDRVHDLKGISDEYFRFISYVSQRKGAAYARSSMEDALGALKIGDPGFVTAVRAILDAALAGGHVELARKALVQLALRLGDARHTYELHAPPALVEPDAIPATEEPVYLQTLLALLYERLGLTEDASREYLAMATHRMRVVNDAYAEDHLDDLNDFFLVLRHLERTGQDALRRELLPVYEAMQDERESRVAMIVRRERAKLRGEISSLQTQHRQAVSSLKAANDQELEAWADRVAGAKARSTALANRVSAAREELSTRRSSTIADVLRTVGMLLLVALLLAWLFVRAWRYACSWSEERVFAFVWKAGESYGLFCMLSLVNLPIGLPLTVLSQHELIHQKGKNARTRREAQSKPGGEGAEEPTVAKA